MLSCNLSLLHLDLSWNFVRQESAKSLALSLAVNIQRLDESIEDSAVWCSRVCRRRVYEARVYDGWCSIKPQDMCWSALELSKVRIETRKRTVVAENEPQIAVVEKVNKTLTRLDLSMNSLADEPGSASTEIG